MVTRTVAALSLAAALVIHPAATQPATVDEGSFTITRGGAPAGREQFRILSTPGIDGDILKSQAAVTIDGRTITTSYATDAGGAPQSYSVEVREGGAVAERATGSGRPGRISVDAQSSTSRSAREYVASAGVLVFDDDVFHQYYFLAQRGVGNGRVPVVFPRRNVQEAMRVRQAGSDPVVIADRAVPASRLVLVEPGGAEREIWVDAENRVLKVAIPGRNLVAVRDAPPR
ncbi:MAG TPA: hypothetical protein VGE02_11255 [Gemmatimonadales bacterium]